MNVYAIIIALCLIIVVSYVFVVISRRFHVPSVILLIVTGIGLHALADANGWPIGGLDLHVQLLGTVGLIMIVMEAALDLHVTRSELSIIRQALGAALVILIVSSIAITALISVWLDQHILNSLLHAIPLSIVSSAVVIPSTMHLAAHRRRFIVFESSFSDIVGILLFNFFALGNDITASSIAVYGGNLVLSLLLSLLASVVLVLILVRLRSDVRFFMLFAILIALYSVGKLMHVPSLVLILLFGLVVANWEQFGRMVRMPLLHVPAKNLSTIRRQLSGMTAETSFVVRTFFFVLFGFTMDFTAIFHAEVMAVGTAVVAVLVIIRFLYLRLVMRMKRIMPELLLMPRGLITVLLFYSIPAEYSLSGFNEGVVSFVIVVSALLMMVGLIAYRTDEEDVFGDPGMEHQSLAAGEIALQEGDDTSAEVQRD